jgi:hypothetical protein
LNRECEGEKRGRQKPRASPWLRDHITRKDGFATHPAEKRVCYEREGNSRRENPIALHGAESSWRIEAEDL